MENGGYLQKLREMEKNAAINTMAETYKQKDMHQQESIPQLLNISQQKQKDTDSKQVEKEQKPYDEKIDMFFSSLKDRVLFDDIRKFSGKDGMDAEKRSSTAVDFIDCLSDLYAVMTTREKELTTSEKLEKLLKLSQAAQNYCNTHKKLFHWTSDGAERYNISKEIQELTSSQVKILLFEDDRQSIYNNKDADIATGETPKDIEKKLQKAAKAYKNYCAQIANSCMGYMPGGEILSRKLKALRVNERLIKCYRRDHDNKKMDPDIEAYIREYEECLTWEKLLDKREQKQESLDGMIDDHLVKEGEIEKVTEEEKFKPEDSKENLTIDQRVKMEEIDNWLLRNFDNGINKDADMVHSLLSMSKRERLHVYYLVEKERRRNADIRDVWNSQTYVPDLKTFKKKMVANRAMFWKRITGDYTYTFKLSEAMQVSKNYRKDLKAEAAENNSLSSRKMNQKTLERINKLEQFNDLLRQYRDYQVEIENAKTESMKSSIKVNAEGCLEQIKKLAGQLSQDFKMDNDHAAEANATKNKTKDLSQILKKGNVHVAEADTTEFKIDEITGLVGLLGSLPNTFSETFANGTPAIITAALTGLIGIVTGTITMAKNWSSYTDEERTERVFGLTTNIVNASAGVIGIGAMVASTSAKMMTVAGTTATAAPVAGVVLSAGVTIVQGVTAGKMKYHGKKASDFFKVKRQSFELQKIGKATDKERQDLKREVKYQKNMEMLQQTLQKRQATKSVYSAVGTGVSAAAIACPPLAIAAVVVAIVGGIHDYKQVENLRTTLFDNFFNMEKLTREVAKKRFGNSTVYKDNPPIEKIKESLRLRVAARAGFNSVKTASVFICSKFARLIRERIFSSDTNDNDRNGYIEFVKSIDLRYNPAKGQPDENALVRKMMGR